MVSGNTTPLPVPASSPSEEPSEDAASEEEDVSEDDEASEDDAPPSEEHPANVPSAIAAHRRDAKILFFIEFTHSFLLTIFVYLPAAGNPAVYALTEPTRTPLTKYFWSQGYTIRIGTVAYIIDAAFRDSRGRLAPDAPSIMEES